MKRNYCLLIFLLASQLTVLAQVDSTRQIIPEEFIKARQKKNSTANARKINYRPAASGKIETSKEIACVENNCRQLGLTIWRLRATTNAERAMPTDTARIIVHEGEAETEFAVERLAATTPIKYGEKLRFSFEAQQAGYLYVIDREQYADGSLGKPYLIFPTLRTHNGENQVAPGRMIEIPAQDDRPNYFTLKQSRADNVGELLTVIVAPQRLENLQITEKAQALDSEQVKIWEQKWGGKTEQFEMIGGDGLKWTKIEQQAGERTRDLTQDDPSPQTIYRVIVKPDAPMLIKVGLRYRKNSSKK